MSRRANKGQTAKTEIARMPKVPTTNPLVTSLPSVPRVPPALKRLKTAPQFDESWFDTYDSNPDAAKLFRQEMVKKNPGRNLEGIMNEIKRKRVVMDEKRRKDRLLAAKQKREEGRKAVLQQREREEKQKKDQEAHAKCVELQKKVDVYLQLPIEKIALKTPLFGGIHKKYQALVSREIERVREIIKNECFLRRKVPNERELFKPMNKIVENMKKEMCQMMKEDVKKRYSVTTNPTIKKAYETHPEVYKKYLPMLNENMKRITDALDELCPIDETNRYFDQTTVDALMERVIYQMKGEMRAGGKKRRKTRRFKKQAKKAKTRRR